MHLLYNLYRQIKVKQEYEMDSEGILCNEDYNAIV
jgi:hypothetical protein